MANNDPNWWRKGCFQDGTPNLEVEAPYPLTVKDSKDTLPVTGYTEEQLCEYIKRKLGYPVWEVELTQQQIQDCVQDAITIFSIWRPVLQWGAIPLVAGQKQYLCGVDVGQGVATCTFVENRLGVLNLDFSNPFSTMSVMTTGLGLDGMGDYDTYLRWQVTWQRVTSTLPKWQYDDYRKVLWIHNPIARYRCAILIYRNWPDTASLPQYGSWFVKEFALAKAQYAHGDLWLKFSGAIPGPVKDIQLDSGKRDKAEKRIEELELLIRQSQELTPLSTDD
jgi:hypothetical protein